jgi:DNA-binding CsgD family transcriptional regulator/tetratricopeptide (TPR) repeat protein
MVRPLAWTGRQKDLEALCRRALGGEGRPEDEAMFRMGLGHSLFIQGRIQEARAVYEQAAAQRALSDSERVTADAYIALTGVYLGDLAAAERTRPAASRQWAPLAAGIARLASAIAALNAGSAERALAMFDESAALLQIEGDGRANLFRGAALLQLDQVDKARAVLREGARDCLLSGMAERAARHHYELVAVEYAAGDLDAALAEHEAGLALAEGSDHHWRAVSLGLAAAIAVHRGELDRARRTIEEAEEARSSAGPNPCDDEVARARYLLARVRGNRPEAALAATEAWRRCADHGYRPLLTWFGVDLVRACIEVGDLQRARAAAEEAENVAKAVPVPFCEACAAWAGGLLTGDPEALLGAASRMRATPRPLYQALCLEDTAVVLARAGWAYDARPLALEALDVFAGMDAVTDAARLTSRLRVRGVRLGPRARRDRPRYGWESLSMSELSVVRLVAEGKTNREVADQLLLSRDTVHTHVSKALLKLGFTSRVQLAAEAARRGF